jgi:SAM-dependent methyltransferase
MMYDKLCTEYYDTDKKFAQQDELKLYQEEFNKNDLLLEPMCGSGRLLIPLMQLGYTVHGLDNSACMLESCKNRAEKLNLKPILYKNSIEDMSLEQKYNGIIIPFGSFQLLYPRENAYSALVKFKQLLLPGGKLILDLFIPWSALYENGEVSTGSKEVTLDSGEIIKIKNISTSDKDNQHMLSKSSYTKYDTDNKILAQQDEQMDILWYYQFEIELILEKYGFQNIRHVTRFLNGDNLLTFIATV